MNAPGQRPTGGEEPLRIWTVYDHPVDLPHSFVARLFLVTAAGAQPTQDFVVSPDLKSLRELLLSWGLFCLARQPGDDPKIVESWV